VDGKSSYDYQSSDDLLTILPKVLPKDVADVFAANCRRKLLPHGFADKRCCKYCQRLLLSILPEIWLRDIAEVFAEVSAEIIAEVFAEVFTEIIADNIAEIVAASCCRKWLPKGFAERC